MSDLALIADLVRVGTPAELVARVSTALLVRDIVRDNWIKEYHRKRKRDQRKASKNQSVNADAKANDVARKSAENVRDIVRDNTAKRCDLSSTSSSSLFPEVVTKEGGKEEGKKARSENARARGQRMVAGALLTDEFREAAMKLGAGSNDVPEMWAEFVDYWVAIPGQRGCKTDWPATWRNRVRDVLKRGNRNGRPRQQSLSDRARDLAEQARSAERARGLI